MRRLTSGRGPSSRPGPRCAVEETPSQKLDSLSRNRRLSRVSSIPVRQFQAGYPIEKPIPKTKTKKNEPTRRQIYNRTTPGEKGGLDVRKNVKFGKGIAEDIDIGWMLRPSGFPCFQIRYFKRTDEFSVFPPGCAMEGAKIRPPAVQPPAPANESFGQLTPTPWNCNPTPYRPSGSRWQ